MNKGEQFAHLDAGCFRAPRGGSIWRIDVLRLVSVGSDERIRGAANPRGRRGRHRCDSAGRADASKEFNRFENIMGRNPMPPRFGQRAEISLIALVILLSPGSAPAVDLSVGSNINVSVAASEPTTTQQYEVTLDVDPRNTDHWFVFANHGPAQTFAAYSVDRGANWGRSNGSFAFGISGQPVPVRDPSVAWDGFGNLYVAYYVRSGPNDSQTSIAVARSIDNGANFTQLQIFAPLDVFFEPPEPLFGFDQPTLAVGPGELDPVTGIRTETLWLTYHVYGFNFSGGPVVVRYGLPRVRSAQIRGRGPSDVGPFDQEQALPLEGALLDVSAGPSGEAMVAYSRALKSSDDNRPIAICHDANGRTDGLAFSCSTTSFDTEASTVPEIIVRYDRSSATIARVYLGYSRKHSVSSRPEVFLRSCDTASTAACSSVDSWTAAQPVSDDVNNYADKALPAMDVDSASGLVALSWYDTRGDDPLHVREELYAVVREPGPSGNFSPRHEVSTLPGSSENSSALSYGDYTGLSFFGGVFFASWADNSQAPLPSSDTRLDAYVAAIEIIEGAEEDPNTGGDEIPNSIDNCTAKTNLNQLDADLDGFGNYCDADFNQTGLVNIGDFGFFKSCLGSSDPNCGEADLDGNGTIESTDDFAIFTSLYGKAPGPSGSKCAKSPPRDRSCL